MIPPSFLVVDYTRLLLFI